ncbi:MAG TPA: GNAT family N-acetyltransferase [Pedococcus sp.]|jgi:GNAT superfamily N-acetyltransferase|nr:GNAT family N-acetyltransferase [Pedococcus sp.]
MPTPDHQHDHAQDHSQHDHSQHDHSQQRGPLADASVRLARVSDAPAVGIVQSVVWREAYAEVVPAEAVESFEPQAFGNAWRRSLGDPPPGVHRLLVACAGDQVVGFAAIGPSQDPDTSPETGELTALGVHPNARRAGHGSRLLNAAVDTLRGAGATAMSIWVLATDEGTRAFLTRSGLAPDSAFRDRVVSPDGDTAREVRLMASLVEEEPPPPVPQS